MGYLFLCAYQGVRDVGFSEYFVYELNIWSIPDDSNNVDIKTLYASSNT